MSESKTGLNPIAINEIQDKLYKIGSLDEKSKDKIQVSEAANEIEKLIFIDPLTGCFNGNFFKDYLKKFDPRRDVETSVIIFDINDLKKTNDSKGHDAGDKLIIDSVSFIKKSLRKGDILIRDGDKSDELRAICKVEEKNRDIFEKLMVERFNEQSSLPENLSVNFAFGVAHFDGENDRNDIRETIKRADKLMYEKKAEQKSK